MWKAMVLKLYFGADKFQFVKPIYQNTLLRINKPGLMTRLLLFVGGYLPRCPFTELIRKELSKEWKSATIT